MYSLCSLYYFFSTLQVGLTSCTKDKTIYDTITHTVYDTITKRDTVVIKDTAITLQLLTANPWKLQAIQGVEGNTIIFYQRGGANNTANYDTDNITFNADKTGTYTDGNNAVHAITWDFTNATQTQITLVVSNPSPLLSQTMVYDNLRYKNKQLLFDQYWSYNNKNAHAQVIRVGPSY